jgi:glucose/arabinose dehydrogenase
MKKIGPVVLFGVLAVTILLVFGATRFYGSIRPALFPPVGDIAERENSKKNGDEEKEFNNLGLRLSDGFSISIFANDLPSARVITEDRFGNFWVSQSKEGTISLLEVDGGELVAQNVVFRELNNPHGLAIDPKDPLMLYVAEEHQIFRTRLYSDGNMEVIAHLPEGGRHTTRTIGFGVDERLYVSIGSSCDVCRENDEMRATIYSMEKDGSDMKLFAKGLRNSVFFMSHPETGEMWATDMGRDGLGDNLPPDEINVVREGNNYGWPTCYGKNIHDVDFDNNTYIRNPCMDPHETSSFIDIPAHSSPLGLAFVPKTTKWPVEYWGDLLVAYHGSWNRSEPTGYKVVRMKLDQENKYIGSEDFISGWLVDGSLGVNAALGRPVDIFISKSGSAYISDDKAGVIYKLTYTE